MAFKREKLTSICYVLVISPHCLYSIHINQTWLLTFYHLVMLSHITDMDAHILSLSFECSLSEHIACLLFFYFSCCIHAHYAISLVKRAFSLHLMIGSFSKSPVWLHKFYIIFMFYISGWLYLYICGTIAPLQLNLNSCKSLVVM